MILNFCRHLFAPDKFFHILIPFLKKKTVDPFFALGKNKKGKMFVQDCNTHSLVFLSFSSEARCTVRTSPFLFEAEDFFSGSLPSTRIRSKRSPKTHLFENARRSGDFWKRHFGYQWMRMLPSKMVPFSVTIAFSSGRAKKIKKHNVWTLDFVKTEKKSLFSSKNGYMWTGPETLVKAIMWETKTRRLSDKKNTAVYFTSTSTGSSEWLSSESSSSKLRRQIFLSLCCWKGVELC